MSRAQDARPLSPHLGIYRWQISNTLSILHRMSGFALTIGLFPLVLWVAAAAYDQALFEQISYCFASILGKIMLFGWTVAFYYHFANGIRHLNWDIGKGFSIPEMNSSGRLVVAFAVFISIFTWAYIVRKVGL